MDAIPGPITVVEIDGNSTVLGAATAGVKWRLIGAVFSNAAAGGNFKFTSDGTDLTGNTVTTANDPVVLPPCGGWIQGADSKDLTLVGNAALDGWALVQQTRCGQSAGGFI